VMLAKVTARATTANPRANRIAQAF
jgi:hypothetical protein